MYFEKLHFTLFATAFTTMVAGAKRTLYGRQQVSIMLHLESSFSSAAAVLCAVSFEVGLTLLFFLSGGTNILV
jgi:hypothetical protein